MRHNGLFLKSLMLTAGLLAGASSAAGEARHDTPPSVQVITDDGRALPRYPVSSDRRQGVVRAYLEAERGQRYAIRVHNPSARRIGLVIAVDGRNIISGRRSNLRRDEPMYVLEPYQSARYEGWRTSESQVHRFYFTDVEDSYAEAFGDRSAMGVIAVAAYREKAPPPRSYSQEDRAEAERAPGEPASPRAGAAAPRRRSAESAARSDDAGTGFGEAHASRAVRVAFEPERRAFARQFLKYEWRETLVRLGVIDVPRHPNRFWPEHLGQVRDGGFAPYPPGSPYRRDCAPRARACPSCARGRHGRPRRATQAPPSRSRSGRASTRALSAACSRGA